MSFLHNQNKRHRIYPKLKHQQGVVIVVALFIVALVAVMAFAMMSRLERDTKRTSLILRNAEAEYYAQGSVAWAIDQLRNNWEKKQANKLIDVLPICSPVLNVNGYKIFSTIEDMQSRLNVNNINTLESQATMVHLLKIVDAKLGEVQAREIASAIFDWIMPIPQRNKFNKYYLNSPIPYRAAHRPLFTISELRLVKGMTPRLFNALKPYIVALPGSTKINVQTASVPVLMTLGTTMTLETAQAIEKARKQKPFIDAQSFLNLEMVKNHHISAENIAVVSNFFLVETHVVIENQDLALYTLLERTAKQAEAQVSILWQSKSLAE